MRRQTKRQREEQGGGGGAEGSERERGGEKVRPVECCKEITLDTHARTAATYARGRRGAEEASETRERVDLKRFRSGSRPKLGSSFLGSSKTRILPFYLIRNYYRYH